MIFRILIKDPNLGETIFRTALEKAGEDASRAKRDEAVESLTEFMETFTRYGEMMTLEFDTVSKMGRVLPVKGDGDKAARRFLAGQIYEALDQWSEEEDLGFQTDQLIELAGLITGNIMDPQEPEDEEEGMTRG